MEKILKIVYSYVQTSIFNKNEKLFIFPRTIKDYKFVQDLQSHKKKLFRVGLYEDKDNRKVVIKIWRGKSPNAHYYNMKHEIKIYKILSKYNKKSTVSFPEYLYSHEYNNEIVLITRYFEGIQVKNINEGSKQLVIYEKCIKFIRDVEKNISASDKSKIRIRSAKSYLLLYPFILIAACFQNPSMVGIHFRGLKLFLKYMYLFRQNVPFKLIHGDLHQRNILVNKSEIVIIDLEQMMFTYPEFELVTILGSKHNSLKFAHDILRKSDSIFSKNTDRKGFFTLMAVFCMTYNFTEKLDKKHVLAYGKIFDLVFLLNKKKLKISNLLDSYQRNQRGAY